MVTKEAGPPLSLNPARPSPAQSSKEGKKAEKENVRGGDSEVGFESTTGSWVRDPESSAFPVKGMLSLSAVPTCVPLPFPSRADYLVLERCGGWVCLLLFLSSFCYPFFILRYCLVLGWCTCNWWLCGGWGCWIWMHSLWQRPVAAAAAPAAVWVKKEEEEGRKMSS